MWDMMIQKVKSDIYRREGKSDDEESSFYDVHKILIDQWNKRNTHCLDHLLNPR